MHDSYQNPLCTRYAGKDMQRIFSDQQKFSTWRKLWLALAESEPCLYPLSGSPAHDCGKTCLPLASESGDGSWGSWILHLWPLGCKGTTGTAASFLKLFDGDEEKVQELERMIAEKMGFIACQQISGQTYSRKQDFTVGCPIRYVSVGAERNAIIVK